MDRCWLRWTGLVAGAVLLAGCHRAAPPKPAAPAPAPEATAAPAAPARTKQYPKLALQLTVTDEWQETDADKSADAFGQGLLLALKQGGTKVTISAGDAAAYKALIAGVGGEPDATRKVVDELAVALKKSPDAQSVVVSGVHDWNGNGGHGSAEQVSGVKNGKPLHAEMIFIAAASGGYFVAVEAAQEAGLEDARRLLDAAKFGTPPTQPPTKAAAAEPDTKLPAKAGGRP